MAWFPEDAAAGPRRGPRLQWRQSARRTRVRGGAHPEPAEGCAAADHPRRRAEGVVQGSAEALDRDVEDLGQFARGARLARRPAEPARWPTAKPWPAAFRQCQPERLWLRLDGAWRDLRPRPRLENHRLRDRLGRPPQLLGGICDVPAPAGQVRASGPQLRRRFAVERRRDGGPRAPPAQQDFPCGSCTWSTGPEQRRPTGPTT